MESGDLQFMNIDTFDQYMQGYGQIILCMSKKQNYQLYIVISEHNQVLSCNTHDIKSIYYQIIIFYYNFKLKK